MRCQVLIRDKAPRTSGRGKAPEERSIEELLQAGVIVLDKMQGPTSHQATAWVRDVLQVDRIGHGGTLDPNVSGVLPIALGRATRLTDLVLRSDKEYVCHMKLHRDRPEAKVREVIGTFVGDIYQIPPVRAAVKRQMRVRKVRSIDILEVGGREVLFRVDCDAGTYIRTLCVDIGEALGVGANMEALRRTRSGSMVEDQAVTLQDLTDAVVRWKEGDPTWLRSMLISDGSIAGTSPPDHIEGQRRGRGLPRGGPGLPRGGGARRKHRQGGHCGHDDAQGGGGRSGHSIIGRCGPDEGHRWAGRAHPAGVDAPRDLCQGLDPQAEACLKSLYVAARGMKARASTVMLTNTLMVTS